MTEHKVVIKKYSDRRLYDSTARRYVNLGDIARLIREGADVKVVEARSDRDVTRAILTQIIVDEARGGTAGLPVKLLRQLVIASDRATHEFVSSYLDGAFDLYKKAESAVRSHVFGPKASLTSPVDLVRQLLGSPSQEEGGEIAELRQRVSELEASLARRSSRGKPKPKSA